MIQEGQAAGLYTLPLARARPPLSRRGIVDSSMNSPRVAVGGEIDAVFQWPLAKKSHEGQLAAWTTPARGGGRCSGLAMDGAESRGHGA